MFRFGTPACSTVEQAYKQALTGNAKTRKVLETCMCLAFSGKPKWYVVPFLAVASWREALLRAVYVFRLWRNRRRSICVLVQYHALVESLRTGRFSMCRLCRRSNAIQATSGAVSIDAGSAGGRKHNGHEAELRASTCQQCAPARSAAHSSKRPHVPLGLIRQCY